ncbi:hypothetical protein PMAYCL1PPCAC_19831, partial [Pristionchus mayeri]
CARVAMCLHTLCPSLISSTLSFPFSLSSSHPLSTLFSLLSAEDAVYDLNGKRLLGERVSIEFDKSHRKYEGTSSNHHSRSHRSRSHPRSRAHRSGSKKRSRRDDSRSRSVKKRKERSRSTSSCNRPSTSRL